jgi:hypothetical protein
LMMVPSCISVSIMSKSIIASRSDQSQTMQPPRRNSWFLNKKHQNKKLNLLPPREHIFNTRHMRAQKLPMNHSFMRVQICLADPDCTTTLRPRTRCTRPSCSRPITVA